MAVTTDGYEIPSELCSTCCPGIGSRLYKNSTEFGLSEAKHVKVVAVARLVGLVQPHTILSLTLRTGRAMSFFPNSSGIIITGGEFVNLNNEGTDNIEKGKYIFVRL